MLEKRKRAKLPPFLSSLSVADSDVLECRSGNRSQPILTFRVVEILVLGRTFDQTQRFESLENLIELGSLTNLLLSGFCFLPARNLGENLESIEHRLLDSLVFERIESLEDLLGGSAPLELAQRHESGENGDSGGLLRAGHAIAFIINKYRFICSSTNHAS